MTSVDIRFCMVYGVGGEGVTVPPHVSFGSRESRYLADEALNG